MKAIAIAFALSTNVTPAPPPYQIAGAYWAPPPSTAQYTIAGRVQQPERAMFVIVAER